MANVFTEFMQGEFGFLTILVLIILIVWASLQLRKRSKLKKKGLLPKKAKDMTPEQIRLMQQPYLSPTSEQRPMATVPTPPPEYMKPQPVQQPTPEVIAPVERDSTFDFDDMEGKTLDAVEQDAMKILKRKTEDVEFGLIQEKALIDKRLAELAETEKGIKEIVRELKLHYTKVKNQQKTYELMKKSVHIMGGQ